MGILDKSIKSIVGFFKSPPKVEKVHTGQISASYSAGRYGGAKEVVYPYDGEKNPGNVGVIRKYVLNYRALRGRSWQSYLDSDVAHAVINKYKKWVVGSGLRLQSEPAKKILEQQGVTVPLGFEKNVEQRFSLYASMKSATYSEVYSLQKAANEAFKNAIVGGDVLVVLRVKNKKVTVECIDGEHVKSPMLFDGTIRSRTRGNEIRYGVEINKKGQHVAYWVKTKEKHRRVSAKFSNGLTRAFLVYGLSYRYDNIRGIPLLSAVLESIALLERYKEASIASAEERAKISYFIEHTKDGTGLNPLAGSVKKSLPLNRVTEGGEGNPVDQGIETANKIAATTQKQVFNLSPESTIKALSSDIELNFSDFYLTNLQPIGAAIGQPIEVMLSKFGSNYTASQAAMQEWRHNLTVDRDDFGIQFYQPIYELWLLNEDSAGSVSAPGLFKSVVENNETVFAAYTKTRYRGAAVPHIDPLKTAKTKRVLMGSMADHIPLGTPERATEDLGEGDFDVNQEKFKEQIALAPKPPEQPTKTE